MHHRNVTLWITRTAGLVALLIALQVATATLGNVIMTGVAVNLMLIVSVMTFGLSSGLSVAVVSPIAAKFFGIGPFWLLIPFIAAGNAALVWVWHFFGNRNMGRKYTAYVVALVCAVTAKFLVLYIGVGRIAVPLFLSLSEQQAAAVSYMFSFMQLVTASVGGVLAIIVLPALKKASGQWTVNSEQ